MSLFIFNHKSLTKIRQNFADAQVEYNKELKKLNMLKAEIIRCLQGESDFSSSVLSELITHSEEDCSNLKEICNAAEAELKNEEQLLDELFDKYDKLISWAELYETASHEAKKMIVNSMIKRIEVFRDYKLNIEFSFDLQQFMNGIDCEPLKSS